MSWHDPARIDEPAEDRTLREELRQLLGAPASNFFEVEPTPEMIALAEDLRREALRRRHTSRRQPLWMLLAAGLPLAFALTAIGSWGLQQKHRADALAATMERKDAEMQRLALVSSAAQARERQALELVANPKDPKGDRRGRSKSRPGELVIPVDRQQLSPLPQTTQVKDKGE